MPIVEYLCECGNKFEEIIISVRNINPTFVCPKCGQLAEKILASKFGFNAEDLKRSRK